MSIIRQDPTTKAWVTIATDRTRPPHDFQQASEPHVFVPRDESCPFCPGIEALQQDPRLRYIIIFKNHGERAGTSLAHPHAQLVATPIAPLQIRRKYEVAISHYDDTGRCLYCGLVEAERAAQGRIVEGTERFVVFHPFASRVPFETWVAPKRHQLSFAQVSSEELAALAQVLRKTLLALDDALGHPDFNYILHSAPTEDETKQY